VQRALSLQTIIDSLCDLGKVPDQLPANGMDASALRACLIPRRERQIFGELNVVLVIGRGAQCDFMRPRLVLRRGRPVHTHDFERRVRREEELEFIRRVRGRDEVDVVAAVDRVELDDPQHARVDHIAEPHLSKRQRLKSQMVARMAHRGVAGATALAV
jgi:hypothetical protein